MKAIIIAAGLGKRLMPYTEDRPKCLLEIGGKPIIRHQIDVLTSLDINNIHIIKGYKSEAFDFIDLDLKYHLNKNFEKNNILESLFCAESEIEGEVIILYSDIIFDKEVVKKLMASSEEISIVVDINWKENYVGRRDHPIEEAENVIINEKGYVREIGKALEIKKNFISGEFIGMLKLISKGPDMLKKTYHASREKYQNGSFQKAKTFSQAYLTDIIQEMVDNSIRVHCVKVNNGWQEIDTPEDFENAIQKNEKAKN